MAKTSLSDMLTKLSLDRDSEDHLSFYLSLLRRKGNLSFLFSQKACFLPDIETKKWLYLELRKIGNTFVWGCSVCQDLKTFRLIENAKEISDTYCIHAQALFIIVDGDDLENKFNDKEREREYLVRIPIMQWLMLEKRQLLYIFQGRPNRQTVVNIQVHIPKREVNVSI